MATLLEILYAAGLRVSELVTLPRAAVERDPAMLVVRGCPEDRHITINDLAQQLLIKHNSAVELVDRLVDQDLVLREASAVDRRKVQLRLTPGGRQVLARLAAVHRAELGRVGPLLGRFFSERSKPPGGRS